MIHLVGDLQGCAEALDNLLAVLNFSPSRDRLVLLGDLVNRGPDSLGVLRRLMALEGAATCLLGNHDLHLLGVAHGLRRSRPGDTLEPVLAAADGPACIEWLRHQPLAHLEAGWLCVHAGVMPSWSLSQTLACAAEVEVVLRGPDLPAFLALMYGNEPLQWQDSLQGPERWRFVVNALTRMRFCSAAGRLELKTKAAAAAAPPGYLPWFEIEGRQTAAQPIAFGHWSTLGLLDRPLLLALDTGCVWGGALSAARIDGGRRDVLQLPCKPARRPGPG
jgi:bis(5'-nucleosyl)-tetraphosphatase (symmetrical)